jgi:hypothetical protein
LLLLCRAVILARIIVVAAEGFRGGRMSGTRAGRAQPFDPLAETSAPLRPCSFF